MLAGIITEGQYKAKLNEIEDLSSPEAFQKFIDQIPNEKYFYVFDDVFNDWNNTLDDWGPDFGDLVDYFYDPIFDNELKGKPGIEANNFNEFQDIDEKQNPDQYGIGVRTSMLIDKIRDIITTYEKIHSTQNVSSEKKNPLIDYTAWDIDPEDLNDYGDYDETSNTFEIESGSDAMADAFDTMYIGDGDWDDNDEVVEALSKFYDSLLEKAIKEKYGNDVNIEYY